MVMENYRVYHTVDGHNHSRWYAQKRFLFFFWVDLPRDADNQPFTNATDCEKFIKETAKNEMVIKTNTYEVKDDWNPHPRNER